MAGFLSLARRFVTLLGAGLWLGGFTLYTAFVIPVGHRQLSAGKFGFVTGEVTALLNEVAAIALVLLLVNLVMEWKRMGNALRWAGAGAWLLSAFATAGLYFLHRAIDGALDYKVREILDRNRFESLHERYELVATIQWASGVIHVWFMLAGWRKSDAVSGAPGGKPPAESLRA